VGGIAGYLSPRRPVETLARLAAMLREILPRGPEQAALVAVDRRRGPRLELASGAADEALWTPCPHEVGLAQCGAGPGESAARPLWNDSRSLVLVCDADLYNHPELRAALEKQGHEFRSGSDAELLLRAFEEWDLDGFARLNGAFALALYDLRRRRLVLARDRIGERPLYLGAVGGALCFASEIRAILAIAGAEAFPVDEGAVCDFVLHGSRARAGATFYAGIQAFPAASSAEVHDDLGVRPARYWRLPERRLEEREIDLREACEVLRDVLADAVRLRLRAPAPVAMELSGGLASSALVALRAASDEGARFRAYTLACRDAASGEEALARQVAARWPRQVDARSIRVAPPELWERVGALARLAGEPLGSPRLLALHELRRRVRADGACVAIAGSGADLVLAGGAREVAVPFLVSLLRTGSPIDLARELAAATGAQRLALARRLLFGPGGPPAAHPELAALVAAPGAPAGRAPRDFDELLASRGAAEAERRIGGEDPARQGTPLALRAPYLDYRVAELASQLPATYLIRRGLAQHALRRALEPLLPLGVVWRREPARRGSSWSDWLAAAKPWILANAAGSSLACVRAADLAARYDSLVAAEPRGLWRLASALLWHRRCNEGRPLAEPGHALRP
jgi:asparagine synthase (glutamine-hydrolysing)